MNLYKYYPPERIDVLRTLTVRYTQPDDFNDPFDFTFTDTIPAEETAKLEKVLRPQLRSLAETSYQKAVSTISTALLPFINDAMKEDAIEKISKGVESKIPAIASAALTELHRKGRESLGVFALAADKESLLMWAHYASGHRGFLIEFDSTHPYFQKQDPDEPHLGLVRQIQYPQDNSIPYLCAEATRIYEKLFYKSSAWAYEKEWRHVRRLTESDDWKSGGIHLFKIPAESIKSVILGAAMSDDHRKEIRSLVVRSAALKTISITEARRSTDFYKLIV